MALASSSGRQCAGRCEAVSPHHAPPPPPPSWPLLLPVVAQTERAWDSGTQCLQWACSGHFQVSSHQAAAVEKPDIGPCGRRHVPALEGSATFKIVSKFLAFTEHVQCHPLPVSLKGLMSRPQASPRFCASEWGQDSPQERQPHKVGKAREVADLGLI